MSKTLRSHLLSLATLSCALASALAMGVASAAVGSRSMSEARAQFEQDRAFCRSPESTQDLATCLKEAAAAFDMAKWQLRGRAESPRATDTPKPTAADPNARPTRCEELAPDAQAECRRLTGSP
jgi:hypothetical protein